jgi:dienelactone hydrolase
MLRPIRLILTAILLLAGPHLLAEPMHDETLHITKAGLLFDVTLSAQLYTPPGTGPFPLIVINHGKQPGNAALQKDQAYYFQAKQFVERGYAVLVPTREGFGSSGGTYQEVKCDQTRTGELQAVDITLSINAIRTRPEIDSHHIVVIGQSAGGLATMALAEQLPAGVVGLIDMAGGIRNEKCPQWSQGVVAAFARYGSQATVPVLMMYGENDSFWGPGLDLPQAIFNAYRQGDGQTTFVDTGVFKKDSHRVFPDPEGMAIWGPAFQTFFSQLHLPFDIKYRLGSADAGAVDVDEVAAVPTTSTVCKSLYLSRFLATAPKQHRAFALSDNGRCGYATGGSVSERALEYCQAANGENCKLYAVDDQVVWPSAPQAH